jgi:hypothetical protein
MTFLDWPMAVLIMFVIFVVVVGASEPRRRSHELRITELKAKGHEEYRALAERYEALAQETRDGQAAMRADLAAARVSVEAIESMMREVT